MHEIGSHGLVHDCPPKMQVISREGQENVDGAPALPASMHKYTRVGVLVGV